MSTTSKSPETTPLQEEEEMASPSADAEEESLSAENVDDENERTESSSADQAENKQVHDSTASIDPEEKQQPQEEAEKQQEKEDVTTIKTNTDDTTATVITPTIVASSLDTITPNTATGVSSVTTDRKHRLLLEARADRLAWIQKVPLPYKQEEQENLFGVLGSSRVAQQVPAVTSVLGLLYGMDNNNNNTAVSERIESLLEPLGTSQQDLARAIPSGNQLLEAEVAKHSVNSSNNIIILSSFQDLITKLRLPECAMLVQGMRNFCRHLLSNNNNDASKLATSLSSYLNATHQSIQSHVAWNNKQDNTNVRRSLESFIYGHVGSLVMQVLLENEVEIKEADEEWTERLSSLGFVTPHHLELDCFAVSDQEEETTTDLLKGPMEALLSVDAFHSPYEKLQCILNIYHGVNAALSEALNKSQHDGTTNEKILPSADHVLPTLILVVLRAQPKHLVVNLRMVELCCLPEHLRGEAGYAFTNLYGAVQFLRDLKLDSQQEPEALVISASEWREGLESCRDAAEQKLSSRAPPKVQDSARKSESALLLPSGITATQVRAARLSGQDVNLEWALQWQKDQASSADALKGETKKKQEIPFVQQAAAFSRSYSFLTTRPEDVRMADLPQLLAEYRTLVHTTEVLLAERTARLASERKRQLAKERKELEASAAAVDPDLV